MERVRLFWSIHYDGYVLRKQVEVFIRGVDGEFVSDRDSANQKIGV
jgi:hypothetical protein